MLPIRQWPQALLDCAEGVEIVIRHDEGVVGPAIIAALQAQIDALNDQIGSLLPTTGDFLLNVGNVAGVSSQQFTYDMVIDANDNKIIAGSFDRTIDLGGGPLTATDNTFFGMDALLAKFDATGQHVWSMRFGDTGVQHILGVAVDPGGNIAVYTNNPHAGNTGRTIDLGGGPLSERVAIGKFDPDGVHLWSTDGGPARHAAAGHNRSFFSRTSAASTLRTTPRDWLSRISTSTRSLGRAVARLFRSSASRPTNGTSSPSTRWRWRVVQASSNARPVTEVSRSMRWGTTPSWTTSSGAVKSAFDRPIVSTGAPKAMSAAQTRSALSADASIQTSRSPVARGTPWAAIACAPTTRKRASD